MLDASETPDTTGTQPVLRGRLARGRIHRKLEEAEGAESTGKGLHIASLLHRSDKSPFDEIDWDHRKASITDDKGATVFVQDNAEVPKSWSMLATNVVASKYFHGGKGSTKREHSVRQLVHRVTRTIADWGISGGYFSTPEDGERFYNELSTICLNQYGSFNSPVWFNVGLFHVYGYSSDSRASFVWDPDKQSVVQEPNSFKCPQASACFIQSVEDTMEDIMRLAGTEAILFKYGSGTGTDLSNMRRSQGSMNDS